MRSRLSFVCWRVGARDIIRSVRTYGGTCTECYKYRTSTRTVTLKREHDQQRVKREQCVIGPCNRSMTHVLCRYSVAVICVAESVSYPCRLSQRVYVHPCCSCLTRAESFTRRSGGLPLLSLCLWLSTVGDTAFEQHVCNAVADSVPDPLTPEGVLGVAEKCVWPWAVRRMSRGVLSRSAFGFSRSRCPIVRTYDTQYTVL